MRPRCRLKHGQPLIDLISRQYGPLHPYLAGTTIDAQQCKLVHIVSCACIFPGHSARDWQVGLVGVVHRVAHTEVKIDTITLSEKLRTNMRMCAWKWRARA